METKIYKALAQVNKGVGAIEKNRKNEQQNFKFRGIDDVMNELHNLFAQNDIILTTEITDVESSERTSAKGNVIFYVRVHVNFYFWADDGSFVVSKMIGEAMDSGDKAINKALSIALKYALLQMFLIPTEEDKDPDANSHTIKPEPPKPDKTDIDVLQTSEFQQALDMISKAETEQALKEIYDTFTTFRKEKEFISALSHRKTELKRLIP